MRYAGLKNITNNKVTGYKFGNSSLKKLDKAYYDLSMVMKAALMYYSTVDVTVIQTVRTWKQAMNNLAKGTSRTRDSLHLPRVVTAASLVDGGYFTNRVSMAVDVCVWTGKLDWNNIPAFYEFARAVQEVCIEANIPIRWGGCWEDIRYCGNVKEAVEKYKARIRLHNETMLTNKKPLLDFGHYELSRSYYKNHR